MTGQGEQCDDRAGKKTTSQNRPLQFQRISTYPTITDRPSRRGKRGDSIISGERGRREAVSGQNRLAKYGDLLTVNVVQTVGGAKTTAGNKEANNHKKVDPLSGHTAGRRRFLVPAVTTRQNFAVRS